MARPAGPKNRCSGAWTEAKFNSFIKNQLRQATRKWAPINQCQKEARVSRGLYECAGCHEHVPNTVRDDAKRKRVSYIFVDHILPIVPVTGWVSWDHCINSMFCELSNLQLLCKPCHDEKSAEEASQRKLHRKNNNEKL